MIQRFQEVDARRHFLTHARDAYCALDTNVWGILDPGYQRLQYTLLECKREAESEVERTLPPGEQSPADYLPVVERLREVLGDYVQSNASLTPYVQNNPA